MLTGADSHHQPVPREQPSPNTIMFGGSGLLFTGGNFTQTNHNFYTKCDHRSVERKETTDSEILRPFLSGQAGALTLLEAVATDAMADSPFLESRLSYCAGTREDVLSEATAWIKKRGPAPILWVWGGVGIGKSSMMKELCQRHKASTGPIVISFFFRHGVRKLESARRVLPTLSCQLLEKFPQLGHYYEGLIRRHPRIFIKASDDQFQKLILDALDHITSLAVRAKQEVVIILDGVDECKDKDKLLRFLLPKIASLNSRVRIVISSRQSPRVAEDILQSYGGLMVEPMHLDGPMAIRGVEVFLERNFERIWKKKKTLLKGTPRPDDQQIKCFAKYSRGQFAYATALTNYTERNGTVPTQVLPMLCDPVRAVGAFGELDHHYTTVLLAGTESLPRDDVRSILATIVTASHPQTRAQIAALSGVGQAAVHDVVEALPGLLIEATEDGPIEIIYPSFADYLCNQKRAHAEYWVNETETHKRLVNRGLASLLPTLATTPSSISSSYSFQIRQYTSVSMTMRHYYRKATQAFGNEWFHQEASSLIGIHTSSNRVAMDRLLPMLAAFHSMMPPPSPVRQLVDPLCLRFVGSKTEARDIIRSILGGVLVFAEAQPLAVLAEIFNLQINDAEEVFHDIIPFFEDPTNVESPLKFAHPELEEFLTDKDKSFGVGLYLSAPEQHFQIVKRIWERLLHTARFVAKQQDTFTTPPSISRATIAYLVSHLGHHAQSLENAARLRHLVGITLGALGDVFKSPLSPNRLQPLLALLPIFQPLAQNLAPSDQNKLRKTFTILAPILLSSLDLTHTMRDIIGIVLVAQEPPSLLDLEEAVGVRLDHGLVDRIQPLLRSETTLGDGEPRIHIVSQWMRESLLDKKRCKKDAFDETKHHGNLVRKGVEIMSSVIQIRLLAADETKWPQDGGEPLKANPSLFHILKDEEKRLVRPHPRLRDHYRFASAESLKDIERLLKKLGRVVNTYCNAKVFPVSVFLLVLTLIDFLQDRDDTPDPSDPEYPTPPSLQKTILDIQDLLHSVLRRSPACDALQTREEIFRVLVRLPRDMNLLTRQGHTERHLTTVVSGLEEIVSKKNK